MKYLGSYHELTSRQVPGVEPKVDGRWGVELTKWLPLCWTSSIKVRVWLQALPRLSADLVVIGSPWAGQKGVLLPGNYCLGEENGRNRPQTWRQGIRVSADELADAAGSMAISWQGKQRQPSQSHQSLLFWVNASKQSERRERKDGGGGHQPAGPLLITLGHIRQRIAHHDRSVLLRGLARNPG